MGFLKKFIDAAENSIEKGIDIGKEGFDEIRDVAKHGKTKDKSK